jgi:hypothetical protein
MFNKQTADLIHLAQFVLKSCVVSMQFYIHLHLNIGCAYSWLNRYPHAQSGILMG